MTDINSTNADATSEAESTWANLSRYAPLAWLIVVAALAGLAISIGFGQATMTTFMHGFMGVFLIIFALLKLFDLQGFRAGFAKYDLAARHIPTYGLIYPFIELALGHAYLAFWMPPVTYLATLVVFTFGTFGVVSALRRGLNINCPCMGNILSVPLSTVTLTEDLAMVTMALMLLYQI
ncbi:MAG: MauE/DoxX family redox-associated membrane protein [Pseudomonadota bacterium]